MNDQPPNQDNVNIFEQINSICKEFRRAIRSGGRPEIEEWLTRVNGDARTTLFSNLLEIEVNHRFRSNESPTSGDYLKRFPQFASQVRQVFDESTMGSIEEIPGASGDSAVDTMTRTFDNPAANRLGDYELIRELGRGGMGVVYEARHLKRNYRVALKTLPTGGEGQEFNADKLHRFRKEFRTLSEINHPNLVGMQTLEVDGSQWFFTMDLIDGEDFLSYVRPAGELKEPLLRESLKQLVLAIIALHDQRIVHRDLKPSNVLVDSAGKLTVLDFGLVAQLQAPTDLTVSKSEMFAGTPRYAAPEQLFGDRSEASDWYAVGVMLFEALTGEPPFQGKHMELLRKKQNEEPPQLTGRSDVPQDLAELVDGLLRRDPADRLVTQKIVESLELDVESTSHHTATTDDDDLGFESLKDETGLVGREEQLNRLESAWQELLKNNTPVVTWIAGKSGEGKSSLVASFLYPIQKRREMLVLAGRCYDRESVPFKALDSIIDSLCRYLRNLPQAEIDSILPDDIQSLAHLFPALRRVREIEKRSTAVVRGMDEGQIRKRASFALLELCKRIGERLPILLFIDDLQWGDGDSAEILLKLFRASPPPPILFLGGFRIDEKARSDFLNNWDNLSTDSGVRQTQVDVGPLSSDQCAELMSHLVSVDRDVLDELTNELHKRTGGNPYLIEQLAEHYDPESKRFRAFALAEVINARLKKLPESSKPLLEMLAVAGKAVPIDELATFLGLQGGIFEQLTRMRSERLVRYIGSDKHPTVDTYHDRIRETVLTHLKPERIEELHLAIGMTLEQLDQVDPEKLFDQVSVASEVLGSEQAAVAIPPRIYDLAYHFLNANDQRAFVYQLLAGEEAARACAMENAIEHLTHAEKLVPKQASDSVRYRLYRLLGWVNLRLRNSDAAFDYFNRCLDLADNDLAVARTHFSIALLYRQIGDMKSAIVSSDKSLSQIGRRRPQTSIGEIGSFLWNLGRTILVPNQWQTGWSVEARLESKMEVQVCRSLVDYSYDHERVTGLCRLVSRMAIAARHTGERDIIRAVDPWMTGVLAGFGIFSPLARIFINKWENEKKAIVEPELRAGQLAWFGTALYILGKTEPARRYFPEAIALMKQYGTDWDLNFAFHQYRRFHNWVGSSADEIAVGNQEIASAELGDNTLQIGWARYGLAYAHARAGHLVEAQRNIQLSAEVLLPHNYHLTNPIFHLIHSFVWLQCSQYERAKVAAQTSWAMQEKFRTQTFCSAQGLCFLMHAMVGPNWNEPRACEFDRSQLKKYIRKARIWNFMLPAPRPWMGRAIGRSLWALGRRKSAIRWLRYAVRKGRQYSFGYELARGLLDLAAVDEQNRESNHAEAIEMLRNLESVIPRAESWLLGDQYDEAVIAPDFDLDVWEREHGKISADAATPS